MGKKKPEEMAEHRDVFVGGAMRNGLPQAKATLLFDLMEKFAGYGFNKSHAAAYALVAYQTAYFKAHHAAAFMAANLSLVMDDTDKVRLLHEDALAQGLEVLPPDVNASAYRFEPVDRSRLRYGLGAVKGTGQAAIEAIVSARTQGGPFADLFDFFRRIDKRLVNRRVVEALIRAGAFDAVDPNRAALMASVGVAAESAEQAERSAGQSSLFGEEPGRPQVAPMEVKPWSELERLQNEKAALGFFLSGHPFRAYEEELAGLVRTRLDQLQARREPVLVAGMITALRTQVGRRGKMAFVTLDDGHDHVEVTVYNELLDSVRALLREDQLLVAEVRVMQRVADNGDAQGLRIVAESLFDIGTARRRFARAIHVRCNGGTSARRLAQTLEPYRMPAAGEASAGGPVAAAGNGNGNGHAAGCCPIRITYRNERAVGEIDLPGEWQVRPDDTLVAELREWFSPENVLIVY